MTAPGITSPSYRSSTMKHSRAGVVSTFSPVIVVLTEEMPVLVIVLCLVELVIWSATLVSRAGDRPDTTLDPGGAGKQAPEGWRTAAPGVGVDHQGEPPPAAAAGSGSPRVCRDDTSRGARPALRWVPEK